MYASSLPSKLAISSVVLGCALLSVAPAAAQKKGGTLRLYHNDTPPSTSLLEESTIASVTPFAAIFNNLVVFDPAKPHESLETVIGDLAESWSWDATNTKLTFKLHQGVKWHDGQPFTAKDVQCTWRMLIGKGDTQDFHRNPRKVWYANLQDVTINGDYEATFELSEPQPSLPVLLASAFSVIYPCHIPQATMRTRPVGTGPFKLVEFNRGASIRLVRNPDYWKKDRPLSGRDHVSDDRQPRDADAGIRDRRIRYHLSGGYQRFPDEGCQGACAERDLRDDHHWHAIEPDGQPRQSAVRQSGDPQSHVAGDRSQGLQHDFDGRIGADGRGHAAEAGGRMGHAAGNGVVADGVWSRHRRKYRASPRDHAEAWLQRCQAAGNQDSDAKSSELSRSRGDRHRSAQEDLHRRRAGYSGNAAMVCAARAEGLHDRIERHRRQRRRSRRQYRRELFLQVGAQLYPVLQCGGGSTARRAVPRTGQGETPENRLGYR